MSAHPMRGFVKGRGMTQIIKGLDTISRCVGVPHAKSDMPCMLFLDIKAAFPSDCREYMFLALQFVHAPEHLVQFLLMVYSTNIIVDSDGQWLFPVLSGVAQGCPLSGVLFVIIMDSAVRAMQIQLSALSSVSCARAAADDLGFALQKLAHLKSIAGIGKFLELAAHLFLIMLNCVLAR